MSLHNSVLILKVISTYLHNIMKFLWRKNKSCSESAAQNTFWAINLKQKSGFQTSFYLQFRKSPRTGAVTYGFIFLISMLLFKHNHIISVAYAKPCQLPFGASQMALHCLRLRLNAAFVLLCLRPRFALNVLKDFL